MALHFLAIYYTGCSDHTLIRMTQVFQSCFTILFVIRCLLAFIETIECPALTRTRLQPIGTRNCTVLATEMSTYHVEARAVVLSYGAMALGPIMMMLNNISVKYVILPVISLLSIINVCVVITFVPPEELMATLMFPLFAGGAVLAIGYRSDYQAIKMWQERLRYVKEQDAWMATVAHNIG